MAKTVSANLDGLLEQLYCLEAENRLLRRLAQTLDAHAAERERERRRLAALEHITASASWEWIAAEGRSELSDGMRRLLELAPDDPAPSLRRVLRLLDRRERHRAVIQLRRLADGAPWVQDYALRESGAYLRVAGFAEFDEQRRLTRICVVCQRRSRQARPARPGRASVRTSSQARAHAGR